MASKRAKRLAEAYADLTCEVICGSRMGGRAVVAAYLAGWKTARKKPKFAKKRKARP